MALSCEKTQNSRRFCQETTCSTDNETDQPEFEVFGEGESIEGSQAWRNCTKYPGHEGFVPLPEFGLQHLPETFRTKDVLDIVKTRADLTARLRIRVSPHRPQDDPFAKDSGKIITGTAWVAKVEQHDDGDCICAECKTKAWEISRWWHLHLFSASHCVTDDWEANNAKLDFFYDTEESSTNGMKTVCGVKLLGSQNAVDNCLIECATHDAALGTSLMKKFMQGEELRLRIKSVPVDSSLHKTMVCISHPHGKPKHVSVGELIDEHEVLPGDYEKDSIIEELKGYNQLLDYNTKTCPGSSGAMVICLSDLVCKRPKWFSSCCTHLRGNKGKMVNTGFGKKCKNFLFYFDSCRGSSGSIKKKQPIAGLFSHHLW